jgi:hypothetical protein
VGKRLLKAPQLAAGIFTDRVWSHIANAFHARNKLKGVDISQIRILPDKTQGFLVIGYEGNRPLYILDHETGNFKSIPTLSKGESQEFDSETFIITELIRHLEYLRLIRDVGHKVSDEKIRDLEKEIQERKSRLTLK